MIAWRYFRMCVNSQVYTSVNDHYLNVTWARPVSILLAHFIGISKKGEAFSGISSNFLPKITAYLSVTWTKVLTTLQNSTFHIYFLFLHLIIQWWIEYHPGDWKHLNFPFLEKRKVKKHIRSLYAFKNWHSPECTSVKISKLKKKISLMADEWWSGNESTCLATIIMYYTGWNWIYLI